MELVLTVMMPYLAFTRVFLTSSDASTLSGILEMATQLVTWLITSMGSWLNFITDNPIVLVLFLLMLAGAGIGFLMRIWHSA